MKCAWIHCLLLLLTVALGGCSSLSDRAYRWTKHRQAKRAFRQADTSDVQRPLRSDYARGWKHGYWELSLGSNGEPPPVPPKKYWGVRHRNEKGQLRVAAWYEGGKDDPKLQLLRFETEHAQIWLNENNLFAGVKLLLGRDPKKEYGGKTAEVRLS